MKSVFTLVPSAVFSEENARGFLSEVVLLSKEEPLSFVQVPVYDSVLVYAGDRPHVYDLMMSTFKISEHNKILASLRDGELSLVVAQGPRLLLCNVFQAPDFTTAQYYIFLALKQLQINPELSSIYFTEALEQSRVQSLLSYFKNFEVLK